MNGALVATSRSETPDASSPFSIESAVDRDAVRLVLHGELDMAATPDLAFELAEAFKLSLSALVIDASELTFCDSSGIRALLYAARRSEESGVALRIVGVNRTIRRTLEVVGVRDVLHFDSE
jgi:anti-sigma B factor antagonist